MQYTDFNGLNVSRLGFGCMRLPMDERGEIDQDAAQEMIDYALAHGINYIDTAYRYHAGQSEPFLGKALAKHPRDSYLLASKLPTWLCETEEDAPRIFAEQLENCNTPYFDFYLLHSLDEDSWPDVPKLHMIEYLRTELAAGRIRHLGASFHCKPEMLRQVLTDFGDDLEFIQLQLNYFDWEYDDAEALYAVAREFNKPVVVMEPIRGGMLADPMSEQAKQILDQAFSGQAYGAGEEKAAARYASYGLRFVNELDGILCTLSGMSSLQQLKDNIAIFDGAAMTKQERDAIDQAVLALKGDILIPCTGCNYCFECPQNIPIPKLFKLYNNAAAKGFHDIWSSLSGKYNAFEVNGKDCIACGNCEAHCPQKISIIAKLAEIDAKYKHLAEIGE